VDQPQVQNNYVTGGWAGNVYSDTVVLDDMVVDGMEFVSITDNIENGGTYFWNGKPPTQGNAVGIMGLAYHQLSNSPGSTPHPTTMSQLVSKGFPNSFSLRLCHTDPGQTALYLPDGQVGELAFGSVEALMNGTAASSFKSIKVHDMGMTPDEGAGTYYYDVKMTGIDVLPASGSTGSPSSYTLPNDWSGWQFTIFDSGWGSAGALMANVHAQVLQQLQDVTGMDVSDCVSVDLSTMPTLQFNFEASDGSTTPVAVRPSIYMADNNGHVYCASGAYAFGLAQTSGNNVMGNVVQSQYFEIFDRTSTPPRIMLADPMDVVDDVCACLRGMYSAADQTCQCYPGFTGAHCDQTA